MKNIGYRDGEIDFIRSSYPIHNYDEATLLYLIKNLVLYFQRNTLENEDIIHITTKVPNVITMSIENIKMQVNELSIYDFNKVEVFQMIKNYPYLLNISSPKIKNKVQILLEIGFSKKQVHSLFLLKPSLFNQNSSILERRISFFQELGFEHNDIISMISSFPDFIDQKEEVFLKRWQDLKDFGLNEEEIVKVCLLLPEILLLDEEEIRKKIMTLKEASLTSQEILFFLKKIPIIVKETYLEKVKTNLEILDSFGFSVEDRRRLLSKNPYLLLFDKDSIQDNFKNFLSFSFYHKEVVDMLIHTPLLFTYNKAEIRRRLQFFQKKDLLELVKEHSKLLLFPLELIEKRFSIIEEGNYRDLYLTDIAFYQKYHLDREEIIGR